MKKLSTYFLILFFILTYSAKSEDTLHITSPIGNEKYLLGSKIIISWTGIPIQDTVIIKLSTDFGKNWDVVTDSAWGGIFKWKITDKKIIGKICKFTVQSKKVLPFDPLKIECHTIIKPFINDTNNLSKKTSLVSTFDISSSG